MATKRKRIEYLLGSLGAAATAAFFVALIFVPWANADRVHRFISYRVGILVSKQGINPVELAAIVDHPVERVCFGYEFTRVHTVAERNGVAVDLPTDTQIPESSYGLLLVAPEGAVVYDALHNSYFTAPSYYRCYAGGRLALQFDDTYPLAGGRLVDLDAPDLRPTMIE